MSLKVMTWAWALPLAPTPKFVLMALADEADDSGYCFPSHGRIAKKCSVNERTVRRMISVLSAGGYLVVKRRFNNRARTSNGYQLLIDHPRTNCPGAPDTDVQGDRTALSGGSGHACPGALDTHVRVPTTYPLIYPQPPQPVHRKASGAAAVSPADAADSGGGLRFPGSLPTAQTRALARSLDRLKPEDAQHILDELAGRMNAAQVRHPVRYCARLIERFRQGEFELELGRAVAQERQRDRHRGAAPAAQAAANKAPTDRTSAELPSYIRDALERVRRASNGGRTRTRSQANPPQSGDASDVSD